MFREELLALVWREICSRIWLEICLCPELTITLIEITKQGESIFLLKRTIEAAGTVVQGIPTVGATIPILPNIS
jgi:hypothetical protein